MEKGLRQRCPLSSFLFNMVGEVLSGMLRKAEDLGMCKGVVVGDNGMSVTHLQYADDTIIFCEPKIENMSRVKRILRCFQSVSGLRINFSKSHLIGIEVEHNVVENWARRISCHTREVPTTYLGLPLGVNHNFVKWEGDHWIWDIHLRRQLFGWEIEQWEYLGEALSEFQLSKELTDELQVWANLAPYRVEAFAWQLLHGKIAVKDELDKRSMFLGNAIQCVLCNNERETIQHLFVDYYETWKVWMAWCKAWGVSWSSPKDIRTFFEAWNDCQVGSKDKKLWKLAYFATVWTIWKCKNEVVFEGREWDSEQCYVQQG
ncbi:PREDICTED: uncharacterized protein LOC18601651 [Theobroma cacao]|uniref:Uncharacterized protein LOC18601651 n=1 Tax=Theobroma cacao TaxID=3641 RepID=A0AB32W6Y2_THECC|nr:PREDICTED: uncharacterized protein LOC18601651 [Theobroma cacao]